MKVLVTGGAGFIGSHVVDALVAAGHEVAVVDNLATGRRANVRSGIRFHEVDIRDRAALERVFELERPEVVSHQAAQASVSASMVDPIRDAEINVLGSLAVLEACRRFQVRKLVYAGTGGAAVGEPRYLPVDEEHPADPLSPYGADKHAVEHYCSLYRTNWGLESSVGTSVNTIFDRLAELTGYDRPARHGPVLPGEVFRIFLSVDRAREALGWEPTVTLDDGLRRTVQSMGP
jgi:UDP-glucose 4-epimerase